MTNCPKLTFQTRSNNVWCHCSNYFATFKSESTILVTLIRCNKMQCTRKMFYKYQMRIAVVSHYLQQTDKNKDPNFSRMTLPLLQRNLPTYAADRKWNCYILLNKVMTVVKQTAFLHFSHLRIICYITE